MRPARPRLARTPAPLVAAVVVTLALNLALTLALTLAAPAAAGDRDAPCYQPGAYLPLVANPGEPAGTCVEVEVLQGWAFIIRTEPAPRTLTVWSLHDPEAPEQVAAVPLPEGAQHLRAADSHLYFTSVDGYDAHLHVWDVTLPTAPVERATLFIDSQVLDLEVRGGLLAMATAHFGLSLVDVADPAEPVWLSDIQPWEIHGEITHIDLFPGHVVCNVRGEWFGVAEVSILDPAAPVVTVRHDVDLWLRGFTMEEDGRHGWACDTDMILYRVALDAPGPVLSRAGNGGSQVAVMGDLVITHGFWGSAPHVHHRDPDGALALRDVWPVRTYDLARKGDYLLAAVREWGFHVRRFTPDEPARFVGSVPAASAYQPARVGSSDDPARALELSPEHGRLAVADLSDPDHPTWTAQWAAGDPRVADLHGGHVILGSDNGIELLRLAPDGSLSLQQQLRPDDDLYAILRDGDRLWLGSGSSDLWLYDASDPAAPTLLHHELLTGSFRALARRGDHLLAAGFLSGLYVLDVSQPTAPQVIAQLDEVAEFMTIAGDHAYLGSRFAPEVVVVSLTDLASPQVVARVPISSEPRALLARDGRLWVGTRWRLAIYPLAGGLPQAPPLDVALRTGIGGIQPVGDLVAVGSEVLYLMNAPCGAVTAVSSPPPTATDARLHAWPNPFNPRTTLALRLDTAGTVRLTIHDLRGRRVRTLVDGPRPAGPLTVGWDGRDHAGRAVPAGIYVARARTAGGVVTRKLTLVQ